MIKKARAGDPLRVIDDIRMSPTYTRDAADLIRTVIAEQRPYGVYHVTNTGQCSWYEFAAAIFRLMGLKVDLSPISSTEFAQKAKRPSNSALMSSKLNGLSVRPWEEALGAYLKEKGHLS
ncbi:MAG: sugar nucleotide-binding protein [Bacillota bacterium]|jgi:dTDP-4-dehydrorhamnose reductase